MDELRLFLKSIVSGIILFLCVAMFFFAFGPKEVTIHGATYLVPAPSARSFAVEFFDRIESDLLPPDVHLIVTNPLSAFITEMELSLLLAFIILVPYFLYKIIRYLAPALFEHEKVLLLKALIPAAVLFFLGCAFAYMYVIPATFRIFYPFATHIEATPFFSLEEFTSSVLALLFVVGIMFLLPIFMVLFSYLRIMSGDFWVKKLRHALLLFLVFTAIITPDGTGITMVILMIPLSLLYLLGCLLTRKFTGPAIIHIQ